MALERKFGQWSCQVDPNAEPIQVFQVPAYDIVVTNVSLGPELRGDAPSTLLIRHVNAQAQGDDEETQEAAMEFAAVHIVLNRGQQIALAVKGDNDVHLFGHYLAYHKPPSDLTGAVQARPSTGARPHSRLSQGSSVSASFRHDQPPPHFQGSQLTSTKRRREENGDYVEEEDAGDDIRESSRRLVYSSRDPRLSLVRLEYTACPDSVGGTGLSAPRVNGSRDLRLYPVRLENSPPALDSVGGTWLFAPRVNGWTFRSLDSVHANTAVISSIRPGKRAPPWMVSLPPSLQRFPTWRYWAIK
ncbi:hypothetical protein B0H11DRAFT_2239128 [Mycena galericulata]|nr:hypothetical protein B0H11DRAFT_2239128 [Mycena galericulata]